MHIVLAADDDVHADAVVYYLKKRGAAVRRFDPASLFGCASAGVRSEQAVVRIGCASVGNPGYGIVLIIGIALSL